jgi:16S rRNA C967 or C1407 C5-methylase (RsmB/RsmF family)
MSIPAFKKEFIERYSKLTDWDAFSKCTVTYLRRSIRVNTLKCSVEEIKKRLGDNWKLAPIPWCKEGFWIEGERRDVGNLTEHALGYIYIQEAVSMIPPQLLELQEGEKVLDMCAAP